MKKSEIYNEVLAKVCEVCEVSAEDVITGRKMQAVVDARILHVQYLRRIGLSADDIALFALRAVAGDPTFTPAQPELKKKAKSVDKIFCSYSTRCLESYAFGLMSMDIRKYCHERYKSYYCNGMKELPS